MYATTIQPLKALVTKSSPFRSTGESGELHAGVAGWTITLIIVGAALAYLLAANQTQAATCPTGKACIQPVVAPAWHDRPWRRGSLTHYGEGDGYMGGRTSCGRIVTPRSMFVAAGTSGIGGCGARITICRRDRPKRCVRATVQDKGGYHTFDAAPGVRKALRFEGIVQIRWRRGWKR